MYQITHKTRIVTYLQNRPAEYLKEHPERKWICKIYPAQGGCLHGYGETEARAVAAATIAYESWIRSYDK